MPPLVNNEADLEEFHRHQAAGTSRDNRVTIILVPDIGPPSSLASRWNRDTSWLATLLPSLLSSYIVLGFQYSNVSGDEFSWEQITRCGDRLLYKILDMVKSPEYRNNPIVFISHGIGGLVVKRAIGVLNDLSHKSECEALIRLLTGFLFFGSPHPTSVGRNKLPRLSSLLKATTRLQQGVIDRTSAGTPALIKLCEAFNDCAAELPLISAYETRVTRLQTLLSYYKREILVDRDFCKTNMKHETLVGVDSDHFDICNLDAGSQLFEHVRAFLSKVGEYFSRRTMMMTLRQGPSSIAWSASEIVEHYASSSRRVTIQTTDAQMLETLSTDLSTLQVVKTINLPLHMLQPVICNPGFMGRDDAMREIESVLLPTSTSSDGLKTYAVCGAGGMGKTQIAVHFAESHRDDFQLIWLFQANDVAKLSQQFSNLAHRLGLEGDSDLRDQIVSRELVLGWLSQPAGGLYQHSRLSSRDVSRNDPTWLLIFDNADDLSILRDFWPNSGNGSILITSRDPLAKTRTHVPVSRGMDLKPLSCDTAGKLIRRLTGQDKDEDVDMSELIASELYGVPLAISQISHAITRNVITLKEFLELYQNLESRARFQNTGVSPDAPTLLGTWAFDKLDRTAMALMRAMVFLDPDVIQEVLLLSIARLDTIAGFGDFPRSDTTFMSARTELLKSSLIDRDPQRQELMLHRIIQDVLRTQMNLETLSTTFCMTLDMLYNAWSFSEFEYSPARWKRCEPMIGHIANLHRLYLNDERLHALHEATAKLARLFMDMGWYHIERGNISEAVPYFNTCTALCHKDVESTNITRGDNEFCLAETAILQNKPDLAVEHARNSVELFRRHDRYGWRLPHAQNELCEAYMAGHKYKEALVQADLAIQNYRTLADPVYPDFGVTNKGYLLCELGRVDEAAKILEDYLAYRTREFGVIETEGFKTAQGLLFLGNVRCAQRRQLEGLELYRKALSSHRSTMGDRHPRVAALQVKMADLCTSLNQPEEACVLLRAALQVYGTLAESTIHLVRTALRLHNAETFLGNIEKAGQALKVHEAAKQKLCRELGRMIMAEELDSLTPQWAI